MNKSCAFHTLPLRSRPVMARRRGHARRGWPLLLLALALGGAQSAGFSVWAQDDDLLNRSTPFDVEADTVEQDWQSGVLRARGHILVRQGAALSLEADEAQLSVPRRVLEAQGHVRFAQGEHLRLTADALSMDWENRTLSAPGQVHLTQKGHSISGQELLLDTLNASGQASQVRLDVAGPGGRGGAERAILSDPSHVILEKARYTNCDCENPPWELAAHRIEVDEERNLVTARDATLRLGDVPVLYMPYWQHPLRQERKSGLLRPSLGSSDAAGVELDLPWYWNIAPDRDATLTLHPTSMRGIMGKVQYRYLGTGHHGQVDVHAIPDSQDDLFRTLLRLEHEQRLGAWQLDLHAEHSNTRDFISDFSQNLVPDGARYLESHLHAQRLWDDGDGYTHVLTGAEWTQHLALNDDQTTAQRLPFARVHHSQPLALPGHNWSLETAVASDTFYQMAGHQTTRLDLSPQIHYERPTYFGRVSAGAGVRETAWTTTGQPLEQPAGADDFVHRQSAVASLRVDASLARRYATDPSSSLRAFHHTLEPSLKVVAHTATNQSEVPNYDSRTLLNPQPGAVRRIAVSTLFDENLYAGSDRISTGQWITLGLTSRILGEERDNGTVRELLAATVGQRWTPDRAHDYQSGHRLSEVVAGVDYHPTARLSAHSEWRYDPYDQETRGLESSLAYASPRQDLAEVGYLLDRPEGGPATMDVNFTGQLMLDDQWRATHQMEYDLENAGVKSWQAGLRYEHECWSVEMLGGRRLSSVTAEHRGGFVGLVVGLSGLGDIKTTH
ncbi:MAG: LPS assembly protein LptD [Magnetococcus sp. WYHC-3]